MHKTHAPDLRRRMLLSEWPAIDRAPWDAALRPADLLNDGGSRARHAFSSNQKAVKGYGRWLAWLAKRDLLDPHSRPGSRITPERVHKYLETLRQEVSTGTLINLLEDLYAVARVMDPDRNWSWIWPLVSKIRARHVPARRKQDRLVSATDLFDLGLDLMRRASSASTALERAVTYRDGLMIGILSTRPLRLRNLIGLELGRTFVWRGDRWWIDIPQEETKTKEAIEMPLPDELTSPIEAYLNDHRPFLCRRRGRWTAPIGNALWVSQDGSPLGDRSTYQQLVARTRAAFGHPVNPHLFRDCVATSIAIEDPDHVRIAARLLGHRSLATTERYYNQARSVDAVRRHQELVIGIRNGTIELRRDEEDDL
jgi:integrase/recombinase XerD